MLKFYHAPWSRGSGVFWLLEELGVDYEIEHIDIRAPGGVPESYRAIQPNKKAPAVVHDGVTITERAAICIYLGDVFPRAGLAPKIGDPDRAAYLTWLVYCDSVMDPALAARAHGLEYASNDYSFGLFDDMVRNVEKRLSASDYAAGDRFTAADTQLASGVHFALDILKVLPDRPAFRDYIARCQQRPAFQRCSEREAAMMG